MHVYEIDVIIILFMWNVALPVVIILFSYDECCIRRDWYHVL